MKPPSTPMPAPAEDTVLLTGATGFIGSAIALELLQRHPSVRPLFLVRAPDRAGGLRRLRERIARFDPGPAVLARLREEMIVCGELAGFGRHCEDPRLRRVTRILNAAAVASFAWDPHVRRVNVDATLEFAQAAGTLPALTRFLHVGTAMISGDTRGRVVHEDEFPADVRQFVPYTRSKAEAEQRLPRALGRVPCIVARPSIVIGHSRAGCAPSPSIFWIFRMIHASGRTPFPPGHRIDVVPVDYCARALVHLLLKPSLAHRRYHVSAGAAASCSFAEIERAYSRIDPRTHGGELTQFGAERLAELEPHFIDWFGPCEPRAMSSAIRLYSRFAGLDVTFDHSRLLAEGMGPPPRFTRYLAACARSLSGETIAEQMRIDLELHAGDLACEAASC